MSGRDEELVPRCASRQLKGPPSTQTWAEAPERDSAFHVHLHHPLKNQGTASRLKHTLAPREGGSGTGSRRGPEPSSQTAPGCGVHKDLTSTFSSSSFLHQGQSLVLCWFGLPQTPPLPPVGEGRAGCQAAWGKGTWYRPIQEAAEGHAWQRTERSGRFKY